MDLDLVDRRHHRRLSKQILEVARHEVADADGANLAGGGQVLERPVGVEGAINCRGQRLMQERQVELVYLLAGALNNAYRVPS